MQERKRTGLLVQSVARAAQIINCFRTARELGISEIAAEMDLNKSTVFGLVNTLVRYGYLEQTENKKYRLGITLFELGNLVLARIDIREETKKACAFLVQKYPATIHIATHSAGEVIYLDKIERGDSLISASNIGRRAPMYCTGVGKALLAHLPESYLKEYVLKGPLKKFTPNTISSKRELMKELERVHAAGYGRDRTRIDMHRGAHFTARRRASTGSQSVLPLWADRKRQSGGCGGGHPDVHQAALCPAGLSPMNKKEPHRFFFY